MTVQSPPPKTEVPAGVALGDAPSALWVNGESHRLDRPHILALDRGLTLADGVFETMRAHGGTVFRLDRHLARLTDALAALEIPEPPTLRAWLLEAVRAVGGADASVRLTVTRGVGPAGVRPPEDARPTVIVAVNPPPVFLPALYDVGLTAHVASGRRNERAMTNGLKTLAYTDAVAALLEARRAGAEEALFLDTEEHCSEATASNLFVWTGNMLVTPPLSCGALPGITREAVLDLAQTLGVPTAERVLRLDELLSGEEAFLTSSLRGIAPLVRVGTRQIGGCAPGAYTRRFTAAYALMVDQECGA